MSQALSHPVARPTPIRRKPSLDFSVTGLVYCSMMMFMGLAAINSQANLLFGVFGLMIGILVVSWFVSRAVLRKLSLERVLPEHGVVGQPLTVGYHFRNAKRFWPSLSVTIAEMDGVEAFEKQPHGYLLHVAARQQAVVPVELRPKRRGLHRLNRYQLSTSFPFGFIKRALDRSQESRILLFPAIAEVDNKLLTLCRSAESSGAFMRPRQGGTDEFYGVKEHRSGENPRYIYWRRSARTGTLVAKEMTHVSPPRLLLLVDTWMPQHTALQQENIERAIAMAASLASHALEQQLPVGLVAWSDHSVAISPNRGKRQRLDLLSVLARLPENSSHSTQELLDRSYQMQKSGTTAVLFTPRDIQLGLSEHVRGAMLVISSATAQGRRYFKFPPGVDFEHAMPPDQQPRETKG